MDGPEEKQYRKIIHVDMDSFYASVEQRDNPELSGKAIAVGAGPEGRGGVVATASYEARKFGVHSAMPSKKAQQLCPHIIFVYPRFEVYKKVSRHLREIFSRYTDLIQPLSLDEAYLDVTQDKLNIGSAIDIAKEIKQAIRDELQLTASAGVSINKFIAKIASDMNKPDGLTFIGPSKIQRFMEQLPVEKFHGVGKVTAQKMKSRGLHTGADLKALTEPELVNLFGKSGRFFYKIVRGIDNRVVEPNQQSKSIGAEDTFSQDLTLLEEMHLELDKITLVVFNRMTQYHLYGRTVTLKVKFQDFKQITRSKSFPEPITELDDLRNIARGLLADVDFSGRGARLLGVSSSGFKGSGNNRDLAYQPRLFP